MLQVDRIIIYARTSSVPAYHTHSYVPVPIPKCQQVVCFLFVFPPEVIFRSRGIEACPVTTDCIVTMSKCENMIAWSWPRRSPPVAYVCIVEVFVLYLWCLYEYVLLANRCDAVHRNAREFPYPAQRYISPWTRTSWEVSATALFTSRWQKPEICYDRRFMVPWQFIYFFQGPTGWILKFETSTWKLRFCTHQTDQIPISYSMI